MGTGVTPPVWSPEKCPGGGQTVPGTTIAVLVRSRRARTLIRPGASWPKTRESAFSGHTPGFPHAFAAPFGGDASRRLVTGNVLLTVDPNHRPERAGGGSGWSSDRLLELVRCGGRPPCTPGPSTWSSSRSLRTNRAGNLVLEGASRLDAFSAYPVPTWLPGDAASATAGTPEVGPPQSSRTRGDAPQVSSAHGR